MDKEAEWTEELCKARRAYYKQLAAYKANPVGKEPKHPNALKARYAHNQVKARLEEMFGPKCAYCEGSVKSVSYQHVEHFRPQSIYPRLAYHWENLLLACEQCNSVYKKHKFPLHDGSEPVEDQADPCSKDASDLQMLINPCEEDPEDFFAFEDERLACKNARAEKMRDVCGLNREALRDERSVAVLLAELAVKVYLAAVKDNIPEKITKSVADLKTITAASMRFSGTIQAKVRALGIDYTQL